ncbi:MAG: tRNA 4-thiouridine(8) synthase ThiI [Candidatus Niyogibacteria bacterium CG10_big_fil_rev_8_21_14_0_10_46_36]|uniref:Probable tRNA sulfurtransferase n=1 Tax=Candidatus Niyogibacteria bacterium CG10_big_fil_rev_8_21_14_0_10_46_36 TaxID=1974726 RepID=A0A2H0TCF4_9BACT|nr:MAG: tRNA 4-thiouridine(8) synthase ThiI [Candidatus Niyogibacteria bacterium CG10_big_fil_rev_8_21_14_0_10_46_36]
MAEKKYIVVHYHEIALKGKNRAFFEKALLSNIERQAHGLYDSASRISGRIVLCADASQKDALAERLRYVFGIHHIEIGTRAGATMEAIQEEARRVFPEIKKVPFRVTASRAEKNHPFTSQDVEREVGAVIHEEFGFPVSLKNPELVLSIEIVEGHAYLLTERIQGPGGLPVGVSGKVVVLLSAGFDSPIAALYMMKRGCVPALVHFHSYPYTSKDSLENVRHMRDALSRYAPSSLALLEVPLSDIQQYVVTKAPSALRIVMYRRWMLWMAERVARMQKAHALVTGDSIGQVASQTLENIETISEIATLPILRPLAGLDKEEIIERAKQYGTYDISKLPYEDCCSLFVEGSPRTKTTIEEIKKIEDPIRKELEEKAAYALSQI